MFHVWYEFLNAKLQNPIGLLFAGTIIFISLHSIKVGFIYVKNTILSWKKKAYDSTLLEQQIKEERIRDESRKKIDEIHEYAKSIDDQMKRINGSVQKHHANKKIHFEKIDLVTIAKCHDEHEKHIDKIDRKMDSAVKEIFQEIRSLAAVVNSWSA